MKKLIVFLAIAGIVWACGNDKAKENDGASSSTPPVTAVDGKKIYKQNCVTCHGLYGDMGASGAFNLTTSELGMEERKLVIAKGRGAMTPFENLLDEAEIEAVAQYTLSLKK
jgi:mono/diheme cytochrome c family protein